MDNITEQLVLNIFHKSSPTTIQMEHDVTNIYQRFHKIGTVYLDNTTQIGTVYLDNTTQIGFGRHGWQNIAYLLHLRYLYCDNLEYSTWFQNNSRHFVYGSIKSFLWLNIESLVEVLKSTRFLISFGTQ